MRTFAELFCHHHHLESAKFTMTVFWLCLHRRALLLAPVLLLANRDYFTADFDLISRLAGLKSARAVYDEIDDFQLHPWNRNFLHRHLKVRVSIERVIHVVHRVFAEAEKSVALPPSVSPRRAEGGNA